MAELIPAPLRELLDFYSEHHSDARFGDIDLAALQQAIRALEASAKVVEATEAALAQAREELGVAEAEVLGKAVRALSFLKIHVDGDREQIAHLDAIGSGLSSQRRKARPGQDNPSQPPAETRQRRPRKNKSTEVLGAHSNSLFTAEAGEESPSDLEGNMDDATETESKAASAGVGSTFVAAE